MVSRTGYLWPKLVLTPQVMGDTPTVRDKRAMGCNPALSKHGREEEEDHYHAVLAGVTCADWSTGFETG